MTKYVLNSGGMKNNPKMSKKFFAELVNGLGEKPRFLYCYFAQPREDWEESFSKEKEQLPKIVPEGVFPLIELAFPTKFEKQINDSDIVYIKGGDDHLLQYWLKKFDIPNIWKNKVVGTSSASSHALSTQFWTSDWRQCMEGLGVLPIKFLAHYKSAYGGKDTRGPINWEKALEELKNFGEKDLPIYALEEGHFKIIRI
ncbi:MAG: Type 1 glutamine amidotransferase-like domain-containing protein [Nanoarchaeota archaeon]|nr:Type 1 glutamine amidotransferase-like domain-containing protein [Nanoarchaeota archaeon]MBU1028476.1 Type 1 glutamine amidotransferase-like domain-containing protein [Nanoarchaeota archaeon]